MKMIPRLAAFLFYLLIGYNSAAMTANPVCPTDERGILIAEKGGRTKHYQAGDPVRIQFRENGASTRVKGFITAIGGDWIQVSSFGGKMTSTTIPVGSMESITRLKRKARKTIAISAGAVGLGLGVLAIATKGDAFKTGTGFAIIAIPAAAIAYVLLLTLAASYLLESLNKCSVKHGWSFQVSDKLPSRDTFFK